MNEGTTGNTVQVTITLIIGRLVTDLEIPPRAPFVSRAGK